MFPQNRKTIKVWHPENLSTSKLEVAKDGIHQLLGIAHISLPIQAECGYATQRILSAAQAKGSRKLDCDIILDKVLEDNTTNYNLILVDQDIFAQDVGWLFGSSLQSLACVLSFHRFGSLLEVAKTVLMHELGHMFSLPAREEDVEENLGLHCTNKCIMRQGLTLKAMSHISDDRLAGHLLCQLCRIDLIRYFWRK